jgi:hypothetical protein
MSKPDLPAPMLPASCDLRKFPDMPLDVNRLRKSETRVRTKPEEFRAAIMLWAAAWHEVPAASVPDDDIGLADLAGYGVAVKEWKKVRAGALRGFVRCNDGRLYHPVIVQKAIGAWRALLERRHVNECGRLKKEYQRRRTAEQERQYPTFDLWIINNCPEAAPFMSLGMDAVVPRDKAVCPPSERPLSPEKGHVTEWIQNNEVLQTDRFPGDSSISAEPPPPKAGGEMPTPEPEVLARVLVECRRAQVADATGGNEVILRWIRDGATITQIGKALMEARLPGSKPHPAELRVGYVDPILKRIMREDREARARNESRVQGTQAKIAEQKAIVPDAMPEHVRAQIVKKRAA